MKLKILFKFLGAAIRGWASVFGILSVAALVLLCLAKEETGIRISGLAAFACLLIFSISCWASEYLRAERAEGKAMREPRPLITVEGYAAEKDDLDRGEEYLLEKLSIVNKGDAPAVEITIRPLQMSGRTARAFTSVANLEPGQSTEIRVLNLRRTLERAAEKAAKSKGHSLYVRLPLTIEYQDSRNQQWITDHVVLFGIDGISVDVMRANEPPAWTSFSKPRGH
jgi:hypothetical protein